MPQAGSTESAAARGRDYSGRGGNEGRGRRRRRRGRGGFGDRRFVSQPERKQPQQTPPSSAPQEFEVLPGESLARYRGSGGEAQIAGRESGPGSGKPEERQSESASSPDAVQLETLETAPDSAASFEILEERDTRADVSGAERSAGAQGLRHGDLPSEPDAEYTLAEVERLRLDPTFQTGSAVQPLESEDKTRFPQQDQSESSASESSMTAGTQPAAGAAEPSENPVGAASASEAEVSVATDAPSELDSDHAEESSATSAEEGAESDFDQADLADSHSDGEEESSTSEMEGTTEADATGEGSASEPAPTQTPGAERSYTLREPQQRRPHFAPRRGRRGRRGSGPGGQRPRSSFEAPRGSGNNQTVQISEVLKEGQEILVQIAKEPLGTKGARITSHVALPGRYLVYMPTIHHIGVSRKIASEDERLRLRNIILENRGPLTGGFIVRTAGQGRSEDEFKADLRFLTTLWNEIKSKFERVKAPAVLHRDVDLTQRILRDILSPDFKRVRVDNEVEYERILDFVSRCQPALLGNVKLYQGDAPIFEEFEIQSEIDKALKPKVWLKSGGFIVINQTEALVAIDVNTGKYVGKTNRLEDTIVKTNIDAVQEIVRQIRLRDLGGIIVIDFIDMDERRNRQKVVQALEEALRRDRAPTNILSINEFGLVALTRKRVKQSLERTLCEPCHSCGGSGWIKSVTTVCYEILSEARKMAAQIEGEVINLRVNPEVARALKSREGVLLSELESLTRKDIVVRSDATVQQERFEIY
jgi:ribonuclease G